MENQEVYNIPEGTKEIVVRHGEAEKIKYPVKLNIAGWINAPARYVIHRSSVNLIDKDKCIVIVDRRNNAITFEQDPADSYGTTVVGKLILNRDLEPFGINTEKVFSLNDMIKLLRIRRLYFADKDVHGDFLNKLANFKAAISTNIEQSKDNKGNFTSLLDRTVKSALPTDFILKMPIYEGMDDRSFKVEICYGARDTNIDFWFESVELVELIQKERDQCIDEQLKAFSEYVIIEQ